MASPHSDKRLDEIFEKATGGIVKNASGMLHAKSGELEKKLEAAGIQHKNLTDEKAKPPFATDDKPPAQPPADTPDDEGEEEDKEPKAELSLPAVMTIMDRITGLVMELVDAQGGIVESQQALAKELTEIKEYRVSEKAQEGVTLQTLEEKIKALQDEVAALKQKQDLTPRSATQTMGATTSEAAKNSVNAAIDQVEKARKDGELTKVEGWGELLPAPDNKR